MAKAAHRSPIRIATALMAASALSLGLSADALAHNITKAAPGDDYRAIPGIGPAKAAGKGLLRVKLSNRDTVLTHGPDAEPKRRDAAPGDAPAVPGPERQPVCASDYYQHVLYGYPADRSSRFAAVKATILAEIKRMDAALNEEARASGGRNADYKVKCDDTGEIRVDAFQSGQTDAQTTFSGVVSAARTAGFTAPNADYTIFFDSSAPPACGTGTYSPDERLSADNTNNAGGDYAVVYSNCWTDRTAMHENGHNQGAVQYNAPFSTGDGAHCNDGYDVMCYSDGGDKDVGMTIFCADKMRFDCRHDTYFDTAPEPGEYLESNWNLGSPLNRFVAFDAPTSDQPACGDGLDNDGDGLADFPSDPGCAQAGDLDEANAPTTGAALAWPVEPPDLPAAAPSQARQLPTLSLSRARRYARSRIKRKHPKAKRVRASCSRRSRTSARCRVRWTVKRAAYAGRMTVSYRVRSGTVALASTSSVRRIR